MRSCSSPGAVTSLQLVWLSHQMRHYSSFYSFLSFLGNEARKQRIFSQIPSEHFCLLSFWKGKWKLASRTHAHIISKVTQEGLVWGSSRGFYLSLKKPQMRRGKPTISSSKSSSRHPLDTRETKLLSRWCGKILYLDLPAQVSLLRGTHTQQGGRRASPTGCKGGVRVIATSTGFVRVGLRVTVAADSTRYVRYTVYLRLR